MTKISTTTKVVGAVLGVTAAAAATAAGIYFYGKNGKQHRKDASDWTKKVKKDVINKIAAMENVTEEMYHKIIDGVVAKYKEIESIDPKELVTFGKELKGHWNDISKEALSLGKKPEIKKINTKLSTK